MSVGIIVVAAGWLLAWSGHFKSSFHFNDFPAVVSNTSAHHLSNFGRFFTTPRISSVDWDSVSYQPLLSSWFAFNYQVLGGVRPFLFQAENFAWFVAVLVVVFAFFRLVPGVNSYAAGFATLLFGMHPVLTDTVNYAIKQGTLIGSFAVVFGLLIFVVWPWMLPQKFPLTLKRVPEHGFDEYLRNNYATLEERYLKLIHLPVGMYLWPVVPALLFDATTAVFAPLLTVYIFLFEKRRTLLATIPAWIVCGGWWIFQFVFTWRFVPFTKVPAANYLFSQPWVVLRYFFRFFVPLHLSAESDFHGFAQFWDPLAIAGYIGLAALIAVAVLLSKQEKWKAVAFGIWWFLIALIPEAVSRHEAVEANWRMFLPFIGLALAAGRIAGMAMDRWLPETSDEFTGAQIASYLGATAVALGILGVLGWATWERNQVWQSEASLWQNASEVSPGNGRAVMRLGLTKLTDRDITLPLAYMKKADAISPGDPLIEINLSQQYSRVSQASRAESSLQNAVQYGPTYSPAWSSYAQWLLDQSRVDAAQERATKAVQLDSYDMAGRRVLMDVFAQRHQWTKLEEFARQTLALLPDDPDGQRSLEVAQSGTNQLREAAKEATTNPTVDHYLKLSVLYYDQQRYQDCINAARQALKLNPDQAEAYANIATAYHTMGNHLDDAIAALKEEVRLNPNLRSAKANLDFELSVKRGEIADKGQSASAR